MARFRLLPWLGFPAVGLMLSLVLGPSPARAAGQNFIVLNEQAIPVRDPSHVLLISIVRDESRLVAVGEHGVIVYSDDNGVTWHQAQVPVQVTLTTVAFASRQDGWAAGAYGVVLHTKDGGLTWQTQITGTQVNQLIQQTALALQASNPQNPDAALAMRRAGKFTNAGPDKPFLSIIAFGPTRAMILGGYRMCIRTQDAGKDWADCSLTIPDQISHNIYAAIPAGQGVYMAGEAGDVFSADVQGANIRPLTSPSPATLFGILYTKKRTLLTFGVANGMFRSTDGGNDWSPISVPGGSDLTSGVVLADHTIVITSENGGAYASGDDGQSFFALPVTLGMSAFGVAEASDGELVFIGSGGIRLVAPTALQVRTK